MAMTAAKYREWAGAALLDAAKWTFIEGDDTFMARRKLAEAQGYLDRADKVIAERQAEEDRRAAACVPVGE